MVSNETIVRVTNRDGGSVGYKIPDLNNLYRNYAPGETKEVTAEEIRKLSYVDGGMALLKDYLVIDNKELIQELLHEVEPEYYYTAEDVKNLLLNGSLDELKDCLDFAPEGTIDMVKKYAVELKIPDVYKRKAIQDSTGLNVTTAIDINEATEEEEKAAAATATRRVSEKTEIPEVKPVGRRVATVSAEKYKVIK